MDDVNINLIEIFKILIGPLIAFFVGWYYTAKRFNIEVQRNHFDSLKENVLDPMIAAMKSRKLLYKEDETIKYMPIIPPMFIDSFSSINFNELLFKDLIENHYKVLGNKWLSYVEKSEELKKKKLQLDERIIRFIEEGLEKANLQYSTKGSQGIIIPRIVWSGGLAKHLLGFIEDGGDIKDSGLNVEALPVGYKVVAGRNSLYFTKDDEGEAEKVKVQLEHIIFDGIDDDELKKMSNDLKDINKKIYRTSEMLKEYLVKLKEDTRLKIIKKGIFWIKCPHI